MAGITSLPLSYLETKGLIFLPLQSSGFIFSGKTTSPLGSVPTQTKLSELMTSGKHLGAWKGGSSERARAQHSLRETLLGCTGQQCKSLPQHRQAQQVPWREQELLTRLSVLPCSPCRLRGQNSSPSCSRVFRHL